LSCTFTPFPGRLAEQLYALFDCRDVFVLGNDEAYQHLPRVLTENADSLSVLTGIREKRVLLSADAFPDRSVILSEIEVVMPDLPILIFGAGKAEHRVSEGPDLKAVPFMDNAVCAGIILSPAETLAAVGNPIQIEIIGDVNFHGS
jgi:hypothetical protein